MGGMPECPPGGGCCPIRGLGIACGTAAPLGGRPGTLPFCPLAMGLVYEGERGGPPGGVPFAPGRRPLGVKGGGTNGGVFACGRFDGRVAGDDVDSEGDGVDACAAVLVMDGPWKSFAMSLLLIFGAGDVELGVVVTGVERVDEDADGA